MNDLIEKLRAPENGLFGPDVPECVGEWATDVDTALLALADAIESGALGGQAPSESTVSIEEHRRVCRWHNEAVAARDALARERDALQSRASEIVFELEHATKERDAARAEVERLKAKVERLRVALAKAELYADMTRAALAEAEEKPCSKT